MRYLTAEEILVLHALVVDKTTGSHGVRDVELLVSIAHKPQSQYEGKDLYEGIFLKASVLLEAIANYHVFVDGNKRTSFISAARFLYLNGYELIATNEDVEHTVLKIVSKEVNTEALAVWFKSISKNF